MTANQGANTISVLPGSGTGAFGSPVSYPVGGGPVAVAEFNANGQLDLAVADSSADSVSLMEQGGPAVRLTPSSLTFSKQLVGTLSAAQKVTLSNTGTGALDITSVATTGTDAADFTETNNCGKSVAAGANCAISVTFTPTATGTRTASVSISDNATGSAQTVSLTGTGTVVKLSPSSLNFGTVTVGTTSSPMTVTLTNESKSKSLSITLIDITGTDPSNFAENNTCGSQLGAQKKCTITVTFKPTATGSRSALVSISDNGGGSPQTVKLSGTGQ